MAELHDSPDHKAFRAAFTKSAQEPGGVGHIWTLDGSSPADDAILAAYVAELQRLAALEEGLPEARRRHQRN